MIKDILDKKAYLYKYVFPACAVLFACACNQEDSTELAPAVLAMQNAGGVTNVELYDSGTTVSTTVEFRVVAESVSANTLNITFKSDATKVEEYNTANGTDYQMAPSECFDLTEAEVMLPRYNTVSSTAGVTISTSGISESVDYLLPVVIDKIEGDDPVNCADYIFALKSTGSYSVSASGVLTKFYAGNVSDTSDHLPVYADIILD